MSRTATRDAAEHDRRANCPDCQDKTYMHIAGEEMPCPTCCPRMFEEECRERRLDASQFGFGS